MPGFRIFTIANIGVWVSPWFFIILLFMMRGGDYKRGMVWAGAVAISILVHEFGHALVAKRFRLEPQILLHGWGGLCAHQPASRDRDSALILIAGPGAGLLLGALTLGFHFFGLPLVDPSGQMPYLRFAVNSMLLINIGWSLVNLLPIFPLDGGQLFRLLMLRLASPRRAVAITHGVGLVLLVPALMYAFANKSVFIGLISLFLAFENYRQFKSGRTPKRRIATPHMKELLASAKAAFSAGDYESAFRIGHQLRDDGELPPPMLASLWSLLGISGARIGRYEQAISYLKRAKTTPEVTEARIECLHMLDRRGELRDLVESEEFSRLSEPRRREILSVVLDG